MPSFGPIFSHFPGYWMQFKALENYLNLSRVEASQKLRSRTWWVCVLLWKIVWLTNVGWSTVAIIKLISSWAELKITEMRCTQATASWWWMSTSNVGFALKIEAVEAVGGRLTEVEAEGHLKVCWGSSSGYSLCHQQGSSKLRPASYWSGPRKAAAVVTISS